MSTVLNRGPIVAALDRRVDRRTTARAVRDAERTLAAELAAIVPYEGGLPLEVQSASRRAKAARDAAELVLRRAWCRRRGRKIDLAALLNRRRADGFPAWAVVDPLQPMGSEYSNGKFDTDGTIHVSGWRTIPGITKITRNGQTLAYQPQGGIPPLPPAARKAVTDATVRKLAKWVGLLYQPEEWLEVRPDPAVVVEWADLPGEFYALCVWGHDRHRIMEFIDDPVS